MTGCGQLFIMIFVGHFQARLESSDTNILTAKTLLRIVLKLLSNYHELYHMVCSVPTALTRL